MFINTLIKSAGLFGVFFGRGGGGGGGGGGWGGGGV